MVIHIRGYGPDPQIMLEANSASQVASNAFLKLCRMDVSQETERWARTPPKFSLDGRAAVVTVHTGFQGMSPICALPWTLADQQYILSLRRGGLVTLDGKARNSLWSW